MTWSVPLVLLMIVLAGCSDKDPEPTEPEFAGLEATEDTGIIRGLVVDPAIKPLAGIAVHLQGDAVDLNTTSDKDGLFSFAELVPGEYRLQAEAPGYRASQVTTTVVAGDSRPPIVKLLLEVDPDTLPYVQALKFEGFIECSASFVAAGLAACDLVPGSNDHFLEEYNLDGPPTWVQSEMVWQSSQGLSPELSLVYSRTIPDQVLLDNWEEAYGVSPLIIKANETRIDEIGLGSNTTLMLRVFNQHNEGTAPEDHAPDPTDGDDCYDRPLLGGCLRGAGVTVQQDFTVYTHVFYGYAPPADWLFHEDPQVPGP